MLPPDPNRNVSGADFDLVLGLTIEIHLKEVLQKLFLKNTG